MIRPSRYDRDSHQQKTQLKGKTLTMFQKIFTPHENIIFFHTEAIQNHIQRKSRMYFGLDNVRKVILATLTFLIQVQALINGQGRFFSISNKQAGSNKGAGWNIFSNLVKRQR